MKNYDNSTSLIAKQIAEEEFVKTTIRLEKSATTFCFNGFLPLSFMDIQSTSHITLPGHILL